MKFWLALTGVVILSAAFGALAATLTIAWVLSQ